MKKFCVGYTLLELIIGLSILLIATTCGWPSLAGIIYRQQATMTLQQLQLAITYARSEAVLQQAAVTICPSANGLNCSHSWQHGILVVTPFKQRFYTIYIGNSSYLSLQQSGLNQHQLLILANGLTYTNGHFNYRHLNSVGFTQFNLYFNKALRFYARVSE